MEDRFSDLAERYNATGGTLRRIVRHALVARQLGAHLSSPPAPVADVGGGAGQQAIPLAREGYEVTVLDPSPEMLAEARRTLDGEEEGPRRRVRLVKGFGEEAPEILGGATFGAVLCHGVLMYLEDPAPLIRSLVAIARPGGVISVLAKNADALAMRPALEGRHRDALAALGSDRGLGRLGVVTRGDTVEGLSRSLEEAGAPVERWYGVRSFTDHLGDRPPGPDLPDVLELEWEAGRRDPYRSVARLLHVVGRKGGG